MVVFYIFAGSSVIAFLCYVRALYLAYKSAEKELETTKIELREAKKEIARLKSISNR